MDISLEFVTLTEAEKALDYYENQPAQLRCRLVPVPDLCGVIWRLEVKLPVMSPGNSAQYVAPELDTTEAAKGISHATVSYSRAS
jgi:hypothetical protein